MTKYAMLKFIRLSPWAKAIGLDAASEIDYLSNVIDTVAEYFWYERPWRFRYNTKSFATTAGTPDYELDDDIEKIDTMTYVSGSETYQIVQKDEEHVDRYYDGTNRTGSRIYWWDFVKSENGAMTIKLTPIPDAAYTVTVRYARKFIDLDSIPAGYHSVILTGVKSYIVDGVLAGNPVYELAMEKAKRRDKVDAAHKWTMGIDAHSQVNRRKPYSDWE